MTELTIAMVLEFYGADLTRVSATGWRPVKCPFHEDRIASASINQDIGYFVCHACNMHGGPLKLITLIEHLDFKGAVEFAERNIGASLNRVRGATKDNRGRGGRSLWDQSIFD